jgi:hypothetical protein
MPTAGVGDVYQGPAPHAWTLQAVYCCQRLPTSHVVAHLHEAHHAFCVLLLAAHVICQGLRRLQAVRHCNFMIDLYNQNDLLLQEKGLRQSWHMVISAVWICVCEGLHARPGGVCKHN